MKYTFEQIALNSTAKKKPEESDRFHYIGLEHLDPGNLVVSRYGSDVAPIGEKLLMKKGDVLFGKRRAYQKKVAIAPFDGIFSAHGMVLRPKEDIICKEYFPFFLSSDTFLNEAIRISVGSLSPTINWGDLKKLEFELPPIEEQRKLADLLWAAYELKESYKKLLAATDEMVKAKFIFYSNNTRHVDAKLITLCDFKGGAQPPKNTWISEEKCGYIRMLQIRDFTQEGRFCPEYVEITNATKTCDENDILIGRYGASVGKILTGLHGAYNVAIMKTIPDLKKINKIFLYYYLRSEDFQTFILTIAAGRGAQAGFNKEDLNNLIIKVPPIELQNEFEIFVKQADASKAELNGAIAKLEQVMKSLLP